MKNMKRLISVVLGIVSCLTLAVPCFAAEPERPDAIRLEIGESYTIGDTTITIKRDERSAEERATARAAAAIQPRAQIGDKYYYVKDVEYNSDDPWGQVFNCRQSRGDTLRFDVDNYPSSTDIILQLYEDQWGKPVEAYIEAGEPTYAEVHTDSSSGLSDTVEMSIYGTGGTMWFALSVYQYWR